MGRSTLVLFSNPFPSKLVDKAAVKVDDRIGWVGKYTMQLMNMH